MSRRIVSHTLSSLDNAAGVDGLDLRAYSLMKHGHLPSIYQLADRLTADLLAAEPRLLDPQLRITLPVAYLAVLPACGHLARRMAQRLTQARQGRALPDGSGGAAVVEPAQVRVVRIAKSAVASIDYASSTAAQRREQMSSLSFSLEPGLNLDGDLVVLVDDVRVTGLAEQAAVRALASASHPLDIVTAYVAAATPDLAADPSVERALNHAVVTEPSQLLPFMQSGEFALTIRYLKWALSTQPVQPLLQAVPRELSAQMAQGAADSGLWGRPEYAQAEAWFAAAGAGDVAGAGATATAPSANQAQGILT